MSQNRAIELVENQEWLGKAGAALQPVIIGAFEEGGEMGQKLKNILHGTWLGHPLHPVITDIPVGAWSVAAALDSIELAGNSKYKKGADAAVVIGIAGAVGAAVTGLTDWTGTNGKKRKIGLLHGVLNLTGTALYATSLVLRNKKKTRNTGLALSMAGYGIVSLAAYLGGHLVFGEQIGVDHTATSEEYPKKFVPVLAESELPENSMKAVKAADIQVLLARKNGALFAIANTCSHLGGPLDEGELRDDLTVKCPWHGSVFSLKDGTVVNGPATEQQPQFEVRTQNGQIEVSLKSR
ncbi:Rieske 2Fe-2S domain-containing protein [Kaistella palustris]|uniref:Rieske 2Fe-2S domain-containing protein n=1 Tax=Kaistella palustris TaxID=493376 RepID=UPI000411D861|nr:Rieske 2Fe-2S domain-containing protein [Kaistella palustris]